MTGYAELRSMAEEGKIVGVVIKDGHVYLGAYVPGDDELSERCMELAHDPDASVRIDLLLTVCDGICKHVDAEPER